MGPETLAHLVRWTMLLPVLGLLLGDSARFTRHALPAPVGTVDLALLAAVFLLFGLGLFALFLRRLDLPLEGVRAVESLSDPKEKPGQVMAMIPVVRFFERALAFKPQTALDFPLFAGGVAPRLTRAKD